jgi:hypothetical protein
MSNKEKKLEVGGLLRLRFKVKPLLPLPLSPVLQDDPYTSNPS